MKRLSTALFMGLWLSVVTGSNVWAQATAQISGTVRDPSGAVLPGVEVTATQTDTGISRMTITNETGSYVMPNLALGPYRLEAGLPGFRTFVQTGIVLQVNSSPVINVVLDVGQLTEQVEVRANASQVETRNTAVGAVIDNQRIVELPLNGRNATDLITLAGAAVQVNVSRTGKGTSLYPTPMLQVGGGLAYATSYTLDGANFINPSSGGAFTLPFPDALQEFKVDTSGATVNEGRSSGVSAVTKSGTNHLHGDLFEFLRNDLVNGHSYFSSTRNTLKRNQFGGTAGGAIKKDKLFFFGGYQQTIVRQDPADLETFLPTTRMLAGDWTAFASAECNAGRPLTLRSPFVNNRIDPAQFSRTGLSIVNLTLAQSPKPDNECGHVRYGQLTKLDEYQGVGRLDYQLSSQNTLFGRYQAVATRQPTPYALSNNVLTGSVSGQDVLLQNLAVGSTSLFGPNLVNAFRISGNWFRSRTLGADTFSICDAQLAAGIPVTNYCGNAAHLTNITVTNGPTLGTGQAPYNQTNNVLLALSDDACAASGRARLQGQPRE